MTRDEEVVVTEDAAAQRHKEPSAGQSDDETRDPQERPEDRSVDEEAGVEPEGVVSDTTAIKEAGTIGRPASTMRA